MTKLQPSVHLIQATNGFNTDEVLIHAASLESTASCPLAQAITRHALTRQIDFLPVAYRESVIDKGVVGRVNGKVTMLGNAALMRAGGIEPQELEQEADVLQKQGYAVLFVSIGDHLAGLISLATSIPSSVS